MELRDIFILIDTFETPYPLLLYIGRDEVELISGWNSNPTLITEKLLFPNSKTLKAEKEQNNYNETKIKKYGSVESEIIFI